MTGPDRHYLDDGGITLVFRSSEPWRALAAAEAWLRARDFSYGRWQAGDPAGVLLGAFDIAKWRNLRPIEREALHGVVTGDGRQGPIEVQIYATAPAAAKIAIVAAPETRPAPPRPTLPLSDVVAFAVIAALLGPVVYGFRQGSAQHVVAEKITMRAGPIVEVRR